VLWERVNRLSEVCDPHPVRVTSGLRRTAEEVWGRAGRDWSDRLPATVQEVLEDWQLRLEHPLATSLHWVAAVRTADGRPAVLKLGAAEPGHLADEATALRLFAGHGSVRLLRSDAERGALLLEQARPGEPLGTLVPARDEEATAVLVGTLRALHRPAPASCSLPRVIEQAGALRRHLRSDGLVPARLAGRALALFEELCGDAEASVVLHGDLHHDNVVRAERAEWLAIDPHGAVGDPAYDVGSMLFNPRLMDRDPTLLALVPGRIEQLADGLGMAVDRVQAWGFVKAVLSQVWTCEGSPARVTRALDVAQLLEPRLG